MEEIFSEAISHCRWKTVLRNTLKIIDIEKYKNNSFDEIHKEIYNICKEINGLGKLVIYDITTAICRYHNINIDKVYIIGSGPNRAIKLLNLKAKLCNKLKIKYVTIDDVINELSKKNIVLNEKNGDILESYLCNWQKNIL